MPLRLGPGPVFVYESITASRRWQHYAMRSFAVLALLGGLTAAWVSIGDDTRKSIAQGSIHDIATVGASFYYAISTVQITLVLLAAPAATAGAVCVDRARGSLTHMLVTDLTNSEIVLGKLFARLAPVLALVAASVPVLAICTLLGGVDPHGVMVLTLVSLALAVFGCALALAVSVRARKTHEVLMAVYTVWVAVILGPLVWWVVSQVVGGLYGPPDWLFWFDPYYLVWEYPFDMDLGLVELGLIMGLTLGLSAVTVVYSMRRLRGEMAGRSRSRGRGRRGVVGARPSRRPWWPGPMLDDNPVLWREWHRARPSRMARVIWMLFVVAALWGTAGGVALTFWEDTNVSAELIGVVNCLQVGLGLLLVSLAAPTALAEERVRGSLDVLMTTPLSTRSIVLGKWWAMYRVVPRLAILPAVGMVVLAACAPEYSPTIPVSVPVRIAVLDRAAAVVLPVAWVLAHGAVVTSLGLALATWIPRVGRAVAVSVSLYVAATFGGAVLMELGGTEEIAGWLGYRNPDDSVMVNLITYGLGALNPFVAQFVPLMMLFGTDDTPRLLGCLSQIAGILFTVAVAIGLFELTVLTFERCLGRTSERPRRALRAPGRLSRVPMALVPSPDLAGIEA